MEVASWFIQQLNARSGNRDESHGLVDANIESFSIKGQNCKLDTGLTFRQHDGKVGVCDMRIADIDVLPRMSLAQS